MQQFNVNTSVHISDDISVEVHALKTVNSYLCKIGPVDFYFESIAQIVEVLNMALNQCREIREQELVATYEDLESATKRYRLIADECEKVD